MAQPRVPGSGDDFELPCGERVGLSTFDLGMREYDCQCGTRHAVVTDSHPLSRFVPEEFVATLRTTIDTDDAFEQFTTAHLMAMVQEEFPDQVKSVDCADDGSVGYALLWVTKFDSRRLHEVVVELLVEVMDHAVGHSENEDLVREFESDLAAFDVDAFVDEYREQREFEDEYDAAP